MGLAGTGTVAARGQEVPGSKRKDFSIKCGFSKGTWILGTRCHQVQDLSEVRKEIFLWADTYSEVLKLPPELCLPATRGTHVLRVPGLLWMLSCTSFPVGWRPSGRGATAGSRLLFGLLVVGAWPRGAAVRVSLCVPSSKLLQIAPL